MTTMAANTATDFRRYIEEHQSLPEEVVLGYIAWYSVADAAYDASVIEHEFLRLGLNPQFVPGAINPADAWEKATKEIHGERYPMSNGNTAEILVRDLSRTKNQIVRKIIREEKDAQNKKLSHQEVGEFVFYRPKAVNGQVQHGTERIRTALSVESWSPERPVLETLVGKFDVAYERYRRYHDGQRIRGVVRGYLLYLNAIQMKPSVYFVHSSRADELMRFQELVNGLNPGSETKLFLMPLADLSTLREEVTDAFQREAEKGLMEVVAQVQKLRETRKGPISEQQYQKVKEQYDDVMNKAGEYTRILQVSQDRTGAALEMAMFALMELRANVDGGGE